MPGLQILEYSNETEIWNNKNTGATMQKFDGPTGRSLFEVLSDLINIKMSLVLCVVWVDCPTQLVWFPNPLAAGSGLGEQKG